MTTSLKNRWMSVAFTVHCGETLALDTSRYEAEPAWHRLAINQALACAKARAMIGGPVDLDGSCCPDGALVIDGQYFDHHDLDALSAALGNCLNGTLNTAAEVNQQEADFFNSATAISGLAVHFAFREHDGHDLVVTTLSWMRKASDEHATYAESCLEALVAVEKLLELEPEDGVPAHVFDFLNASTPRELVDP